MSSLPSNSDCVCLCVCVGGGGGGTLWIKLPKTPYPRKCDRAPRPWDRNLDTSMSDS